MKQIAITILTTIQLMIGIAGLVFHYIYSCQHPDVFIDVEKTFYFTLAMCVCVPAIKSIDKFWEDTLKQN